MSSDTIKFFTSTLYLSSEGSIISFCWSSSDILLSSDWILGLVLSYACCTYETRYWAWPPLMQLEHRVSIGPHILLFGFVINLNLKHKVFLFGEFRASTLMDFILFSHSLINHIKIALSVC